MVACESRHRLFQRLFLAPQETRREKPKPQALHSFELKSRRLTRCYVEELSLA